MQDGLNYSEAARLYDVQGHGRIQSWERIYLEEGPEGLAIERRGRNSTGRRRNCQAKWKKRTCSLKFSGCARKMLT
ncbi:MAG: helix-turn-helix domain-containing protein [Peptococcaceae bacterium]|nr:helix-turn-helix domain-containing protein [Peptococcaceae bacterium]